MSVFTILYRNVKWRFHNGFTIVITILQPILWLVLYSAVAGQTMKEAGIENYTAFIFPGLIVLVSFSVCCSSGIMNYMMKANGSFYRVLISPVRRESIVLGHLLESTLCVFLEAGIMAAVSFLFSVRIAGNISSFLLSILFIFLTAFSIGGLSYGVSLLLPNEAIYETAMNAVVLPVFFLSSALFPAGSLQGFLGLAVNLNPFTHMINGLRALLLEGELDSHTLIFVLSLFILMGSLSFLWALHRLKRSSAL